MNPVETGLAFATLHKLSMSSQNFSTRCGLCIVVISTETRSLLPSTDIFDLLFWIESIICDVNDDDAGNLRLASAYVEDKTSKNF